MSTQNISIVIPCYKSQNSLEELVTRIIDFLQSSLLEIILVNDSSPDNTWQVIKTLAEKHKKVKGINLMRNFGQHAALFCGFNHVNGEFIVTLDDDLQNPPEEIDKMLNALLEHKYVDVVIGIPKAPKKSIIKKWGSNFLNTLNSKIFSKPKDLRMSPFRIMRRHLVDELKTNLSSNPALGTILLNYTRNIINIEVTHRERKYGESNYSMKKSVELFLNNILNNSTLPLRFTSIVGIISSSSGFILAIYYLIKYFSGQITVLGWTSMIVVSLVFFGLILLALGIIGEYLIRIITEVNHSRQYVIKSKIGFK